MMTVEIMVLSPRKTCKTKQNQLFSTLYRNAKGTVVQRASKVSVLVEMGLLSVTSSTSFFTDSNLSYNFKFTCQGKMHLNT